MAAEQWGMVTSVQAGAVVVSRNDLSRLVADGALEPVVGASRVYRLAGAPPDPVLDGLRAAWLQLGDAQTASERLRLPDAVVRGRSATVAHRLGDLLAEVHEFYVTSRRQLRRRDVQMRVRPELPPVDRTVVDGLPVTTVARTVVDLLAEAEDASAVSRICQDAVRAGMLDVETLARAVEPYASAYGVGTGSGLAELLLGEPAVSQERM
jgi:hypothetical protein